MQAFDRRSFLAGLGGAALVSTAAQAQTVHRDWSGKEPIRYPDPDVVALDKSFEKYKVGNTPIQRLATGMLWAEGPAWNGVGPFSGMERHPQQSPGALAGRGRPCQHLPQPGRQQQWEHVRLGGPPASAC